MVRTTLRESEAMMPIGWLCIDLIDNNQRSVIFDQHHAEQRAKQRHEGEPVWKVSPLYDRAACNLRERLEKAMELLRVVESETPDDSYERQGHGTSTYLTWETVDALRATLSAEEEGA